MRRTIETEILPISAVTNGPLPSHIPTRAQPPIKANSTLPDASSTSTSGKAPPRNTQLDAKEPTRLEARAASLRATSDASARLLNDPSKPRDSRLITKASPVNAASRGSRLVPGHSRSQSSSNASNASTASTTRPASSVPRVATATAASRPQHATSIRSLGDARLPVARAHSRALSASTRPRPNSDTRATRPVTLHAFSGGDASSPSVRPTLKPYRKPEFNTDQQHYSPKKETTASTTVTPVSGLDPQHGAIRPGSAGRVIHLTEVAHLEDELLQLSIVHQNSAATFQSYRASIRSRLKTGLEGVEDQLTTLRSLRHDRQANINAVAVSKWLDGERATKDVSHAGPDTLLLLAHCLGELQKVRRVHGPLEAAMKLFDEWYVYVSPRNYTGDGLFPEEHSEEKGYRLHQLDPQWSALVSSVEDRVGACAALLAGLQRPLKSSSIGFLIEMHSSFADQILQEICICRTIEGLVLRAQEEWLARAVEQALSDVELHHSVEVARDTPRRGIWDLRPKDS
ncbi:uncharacterized protein A1O5_07619 [Cladophialophora psammophila CBS 110553]|uniref:Uncharacterized protein n=1 Tax=Cladophialophora psammophila CBS 110553 TaxID=1182543 RepID=W9WNW1_9EURO|nr:uncharacterized protein A1O5_07619 [Cladophialophora psammophila CBS 110553]EXJ69583.1 hypothetical protein A1O5_07619 [Cladophialophora psammophila CBS 110553]